MKTSGSREPDGFSEALRAAIDARDVSLVWLRDRLADLGSPVSLTTLSYWRTGRRHPEGAGSLAAIAAIEELLRRAAGSPDVDRPARAGAPAHSRSPEVPLETTPSGRRRKRRWRRWPRHRWPHRATSAPRWSPTWTSTAAICRRWTRILVQATSGTVRELPWVEVAPVPTTSAPRFSQVVGARIVRTHRHPSGLVNGFVFELERPVTAPDTALFEWVTDIDEDYPAESNVAHFVDPPGPRDRSSGCGSIPTPFPRGARSRRATRSPGPSSSAPGHTVHAVRGRFGPGVLMVRWGFDE